MYWNNVVNEVLNKEVKEYAFLFTHPQEQEDILEGSIKFKQGKRRRYLVGEDLSNVFFTGRESDCIRHMIKGKTIRATASSLGLSSRTVEYYLNNMKRKLSCKTKSELVERVIKTNFLDNFTSDLEES